MKRCIYCNHILNDDDVFCGKCGKKTVDISELIDNDKNKSKSEADGYFECEEIQDEINEDSAFKLNEPIVDIQKIEESFNSEKEATKEKTLLDRTTILLIVGVSLFVISFIMFAVFYGIGGNGSNSEKIVGYWKEEYNGTKRLFEFREDGTFCQYLYAFGKKSTLDGSYAQKNNQVTLYFNDGHDLTYEVEFDGDGNLKLNDEILYPTTKEYAEFWNDTETNSATKTENNKTETMKDKLINLMGEGLAFDAGSYIAGDIPAGDYAFIKFKSSGSYYEEDDAAGNILDNENFDSFGYVRVHATGNLTTKGVLVNVTAFGTLGVSGAKEIYEKLNNTSNYNQGGYYLVGTDIPAGSYVVESLSGRGYYAILSGPVGASDIIDNDNFDGRAAINVSNGQYVEISKATITQQ